MAPTLTAIVAAKLFVQQMGYQPGAEGEVAEKQASVVIEAAKAMVRTARPC